MGHFIVPGAIGTEGIHRDDIAAHGVTKIEYLIGEMVKMGGDRRFLKAKIFGAGYGGSEPFDVNRLSESNIRFVHEFFTLEKIYLERVDLGGEFRRKIYFSVRDGTVYRQILKHNENYSEFITLEKEYIERELRDSGKHGPVVLFE